MELREICLDTETTGFSPDFGDRVVEIGCVELIDLVPTGREYHCYVNPERSMPASAFNVHGLSEEFLSDKPKFGEIAEGFLDFIRGGTLVIHNARFDIGFLNFELEKLGKHDLNHFDVVDTVTMARRMFPRAGAKLDDLIARFNIDGSARTLHGALLDASLLAQVYVELRGGRQTRMLLDENSKVIRSGDDADDDEEEHGGTGRVGRRKKKQKRDFKMRGLTNEEARVNNEAVQKIGGLAAERLGSVFRVKR